MGKCSIAGEFAETNADFYFNPDTIAWKIRALHPDISLTVANAHAWQIGKSLLEQAIDERKDYRFETTLGGHTITRMLQGAASLIRLKLHGERRVTFENIRAVRNQITAVRLLPIVVRCASPAKQLAS